MILEFPNYLDAKTVKEIRDAVKPFVENKKTAQFNRDGNTIHITKKIELKELDNKLHNIFVGIQKNIIFSRFKPAFASADTGYEYHIYNEGDVCHYHADGEIDSHTSFLRYASVILHLNTVHEGGELIFPSQNKNIKTEEGKLVIFPPYGMFGHYTTPSNEPREVIVSWFVYNNISVIKNI